MSDILYSPDGREAGEITKSDKINIVLDMSMFDLFALCEFRYYMRHMMNKGLPMEQKSKALDMGSLLHEGFDVYYKLLSQGVDFATRLNHALLKIQTVAADPDISNSTPEEVDTVLRTAEQNLDYWRFEDEHLEILYVEESFAYILFEDESVRIVLTGKIDLLVNKHGIGNQASYTNLPIDHKSHSRESETYRLSNQFLNYCNAVGSNYLLVNKVGFQKTLKPEEKFKRVPLSYDPLIIEDWKTNLTRIILENYLVCLSTGHWKMNFTSCNKFNRICEYYEICDTSGEKAKLAKMENKLVTVKPWDVTAKFVKGKI